jgi:hypothetical protein
VVSGALSHGDACMHAHLMYVRYLDTDWKAWSLEIRMSGRNVDVPWCLKHC